LRVHKVLKKLVPSEEIWYRGILISQSCEACEVLRTRFLQVNGQPQKEVPVITDRILRLVIEQMYTFAKQM
jgi:hypothetical protein